MSQLFELFPDLPGGISAVNGDPIYVLEGSLDRLTPGLISSGSFLMSAILNNFLSLVHLFRKKRNIICYCRGFKSHRIQNQPGETVH